MKPSARIFLFGTDEVGACNFHLGESEEKC
jgi:hypothetical protein